MYKFEQIADLLPEGLSEEAIEKVANLVSVVIKEEVADRTSILEAKVMAFLRAHIDMVKDQALEELTEESEMYRNAQMFEAVKSLVGLETTDSDISRATETVVETNTELADENAVLVEELTKAVTAISELETLVKTLTENNKGLTESVEHLQEDKLNLEEGAKALTEDSLDESQSVVRSSEQALIYRNGDKEESPAQHDNPYLSEEVLKVSQYLNS